MDPATRQKIGWVSCLGAWMPKKTAEAPANP